jgi:hypothetical protein
LAGKDLSANFFMISFIPLVMKAILFISALLLSTLCVAQQQVVVTRRQHVVKRFETGDLIRYSMGKRNQFRHERIVELTDTTIITNNDTLLYYQIMLVDLEETSKITLREIGFNMMAAGLLLPLADMINVGVIQDEKYEFNRGIGLSAATLFTAGALMYILDKPYLKLGYRNKLKIVDRDSPLFFRSKPVSRMFGDPTN